MHLLCTSAGPELPQPGYFIRVSAFVLPDNRVAGAAEELIDDFVAGFMVSRFSKVVVGYLVSHEVWHWIGCVDVGQKYSSEQPA